MEHVIKFFLKFGKEEHIRDFYHNGTVFLNTLEYFRKIEDKELRGDSNEGDIRIVNSLPGTFKIQNVDDKIFNYTKLQYRIKPITALGNIYSMYCFSSNGFPDPLKFAVDQRNFQFGSHCLMIKDCERFLNLMDCHLKKLKLPFEHGFVRYYNKEIVSKDLSVFDKPMGYEYQKEFRFFVDNEVSEPIKLQLGSLEGIAEMFESKELSGLKVSTQI